MSSSPRVRQEWISNCHKYANMLVKQCEMAATRLSQSCYLTLTMTEKNKTKNNSTLTEAKSFSHKQITSVPTANNGTCIQIIPQTADKFTISALLSNNNGKLT